MSKRLELMWYGTFEGNALFVVEFAYQPSLQFNHVLKYFTYCTIVIQRKVYCAKIVYETEMLLFDMAIFLWKLVGTGIGIIALTKEYITEMTIHSRQLSSNHL